MVKATTNRIIAFETARQEVAEARPPTILPRTAPTAAPDAEEAIPGAPRGTGDAG